MCPGTFEYYCISVHDWTTLHHVIKSTPQFSSGCLLRFHSSHISPQFVSLRVQFCPFIALLSSRRCSSDRIPFFFSLVDETISGRALHRFTRLRDRRLSRRVRLGYSAVQSNTVDPRNYTKKEELFIRHVYRDRRPLRNPAGNTREADKLPLFQQLETPRTRGSPTPFAAIVLPSRCFRWLCPVPLCPIPRMAGPIDWDIGSSYEQLDTTSPNGTKDRESSWCSCFEAAAAEYRHFAA